MSTVAIIGRMLVALVVVLAVMWLLAKWARKPLGAGKNDRVISVLARQQLSRSSSVAVLKLMDRALVLGVTEQGVQLLAETELAPLEEALTVEAPARHRRAAALPVEADQLVELDGEVVATAPTRPGRRAAPARAGALDGSILSPATWKQLVNAARDVTVRK
ncbi:MAG TPA: flagellar biosynthetic protein FliO [Jatrophihabitans sp.]|nr:flagellar biosynthetic protein FliO [Jatrophihabitans sp.]